MRGRRLERGPALPVNTLKRATATIRAALASVVVALLLIALKGYAAHATGSVAMLASLADSALDLVASLVILWGVRVAAIPADHDHRFGHGKAEALAGLVQVGLVTASAIAIAAEAVRRFGASADVARPGIGIAVSLVAIALTFVLITYQRRVIAATASVAIAADRLHYLSDLLLNGAVIAALLLDRLFGIKGVDPVFGIAIALWLLRGAWVSATNAIDQLMDKEWPEEKRRQFLAAVGRHPEMKGIHDLRTRSSGAHDFVQFHLWVPADMTVTEAHDVMDMAERTLHAEFPDVEILIHLDPEGHHDQPPSSPAEQPEMLP